MLNKGLVAFTAIPTSKEGLCESLLWNTFCCCDSNQRGYSFQKFGKSVFTKTLIFFNFTFMRVIEDFQQCSSKNLIVKMNFILNLGKAESR